MTQYKAVAPTMPSFGLPAALRLCAIPMVLALAACATRPVQPPAAPVSEATFSPAPAPVASSDSLPMQATPVTSLDQTRETTPVLRNDAPLRYVVKKGDTLWGIANRYLADAWQWPELWYVNGKLANPHKIYPGDVLELYNVKDRTVLARSSDVAPDLDLERLSPQVRESELGDNLPAIPIDAIRNFLNGPRAVDLETLEAAPYLLSFAEENLLGAAQMPVYIKRLSESQGTVFATVRKGERYKDPDTGEVLGYEAIPSGEVEVKSFGNPAAGVMTKSTREVLVGDRMLPLEANHFNANFYPHAPAQPVNGRIISVFDGVSQIGQYYIVAMNRGSKHGLEPGHVLSVLQASRAVKDPVTGKTEYLPKQQAGLLMVFKTMPSISYGLVMTATRAIHVLDHVEKPNPTQK